MLSNKMAKINYSVFIDYFFDIAIPKPTNPPRTKAAPPEKIIPEIINLYLNEKKWAKIKMQLRDRIFTFK